ncbi:MAG: S8 family serine peptidase [Gemmatimonas sp.]|nr:S8 family serine peptidase [Gemmatimonas sp.]
MTRHSTSILLTALILGACAPSVETASTAAPVPQAAPTEPEPSPPTPEPDEELATAPDNWWLLDEGSDHVYGTSSERAYRELLAGQSPEQAVVVAILDSGVDIEHLDLADNIWVNEDEVAGNGVDDDDNGYVDDVHGWSFLGGPDGRDVHYDSYELTRLYAECRDRGELDTPDCRAIADEFEAERAEAEETLQQYRTMSSTLEQVTTFLEQHLGVDSLTTEAVAGIRSLQTDALQARQLYLQFMELGATQEALDEGIEAFSVRLEYGFNPEFDPRPIVGDDYSDPTDRFYGTNRVEGPEAEHGTHVAGIVGAERGNGLGVDGIASEVELMVVRTVPQGDERDKDIANAIRYAVDNGAQIINMSFGKGHSPGKEQVDEAVRYAESRGVLIVHAAGNDGVDLDSEINYPNRFYDAGGEADLWIEVGASSWQHADSLAAPFSNYSGSRVDVFAPGVEILSTVPGDEYERNQGTSMAAPVVSGLAAMLMAYFPSLSATEVKDIILETATRYPGQDVVLPGGAGGQEPFANLSVTGGIVNAYAAIERAAEVAGLAAR